jgi:signal transduction histidine kinase
MDFTSHANSRDNPSTLSYTQDVPKVGQLSNCEPVTKDTIWQRFDAISAPAIGAVAFACALCGITVWFSDGAIGPWLALLGLGLVLVTFGMGQGKAHEVLVPVVLSLSALALILFSGGFASAAACAVLWPLIGVGTFGGRLSTGFAASLCTLVVAALVSFLIQLPATNGLAAQTGILAVGVNGALALAAYLRLKAIKATDEQPTNALLKEANLSRDKAQAEAQEARAQTQGRAQFMAEMSHEIRTPLNAILGFADTMREGVFGPLPAAYGDYPDLIHTSGTHLLDLVSDLLDLSKIEAGRYETTLKPISLDEVAYEGVRLSSGAARAAGVQIRHEAGPAVEILGDARTLRQIVFNLMSNAIKFTPKDGRINLRVLVDREAGTASLEVEDTGVGIGPADLNKIGQPWNQGQNEDSQEARKSRGSGLGLALVKQLTDLQGGTFDITSTLGLGTRVRVTFPTKQRENT